MPFARRAALPLLGALLLPFAAPRAQPMLYEQRLPDGFAFIRFASALPAATVLKPDFADGPLSLGAAGADRVSPYYVGEGVTGRDVKIEVQGGPVLAVRVKGGGLNTILLTPDGAGGVTATSIADQAEYNQTRARVTFYNAVPGCAGGALALAPSNQAVFSDIPALSGRMRSLNPTAAVVRASCQGKTAAELDLGRLQPGGLYSIWLMAPAGQASAFLVQDRIAPR